MIITVTPNPVLDHTLTVPEIAFDTVTRATAIRDDWGGKGFNVSRVLLTLGVESVVLGFVGGATGQRLAAGLTSLGLPTDFVTIAGETRTNVIIAEADSERYVKVNEAGPTVQPEEIAQFLDKVRQRATGGEKRAARDTWALCGSLPPGVPDDFYAQLIEILQPRGVHVLLDTSGPALRLGVEARPFLVKPNAEEAAAFAGHPVDSPDSARDAANAFLERGVTHVALSLGAAGLLLATREAAAIAIPPDIPVKNVTGAGDALLAGLAYALERGLPLAEQARWGVAAGTASAMHEGVGVVTRASVEQVYAGTTVNLMRNA